MLSAYRFVNQFRYDIDIKRGINKLSIQEDAMKKKIISFAMTLCMILTLFSGLPDKADAASVSYRWPTTCKTITGHWGKEPGHFYAYHYGIDIGAAGGAKVYAAESGKVIGAGLYGAYGYCVRIKHSNGQVTLYGHNSRLAVKNGAKVKKGQVIAYVGGTGSGGSKAYDNHLHFGIYKSVSAMKKEDGRASSSITVNPEPILKKSNAKSKSTKYYYITYTGTNAKKLPATGKKKRGSTYYVSKSKPTRSGYTFSYWSGSNGCKYYPGSKYTGNANLKLTAVWKAVSTSGQTCGKVVGADEYCSKYKNNSSYSCKRVYRYATRSKITTTSGYDSLSGYTKYDSKTATTYSGYRFGTPISTNTSYDGGKKTTTSASNIGYYYYAYAAANPQNTDDWSFVCGKSRNGVISYMKQNYSASAAWSEDNMRYFWMISSKDLGSTAAGSQISCSIPYLENSAVSVGTTSYNGKHYYDIPMYKYNKCYKVKTVTTTNYFYKYTNWSGWSSWTANPPAACDTVKIDTQEAYLIQSR